MVPWRVAEGERLYRDVQFPHGPLGPYLAAAIDRLAGRSLPARTALAAILALLHLAALDRISRRLMTPGRASLATSAAVAAAVFLRPGGWPFPFSLDLAIAVAAVTAALSLAWAPGPRPLRSDLAAGGCLLAALLARPELGLIVVAVFAAAAALERAPRRALPLAGLPLAGAALGYAGVSAGIPWDVLVRDGWLRMLDPPEPFRHVYRVYAGLDRIGLRTAELLLAGVVVLVTAALMGLAAHLAGRLEPTRPRAASGIRSLALGALVAAAAVALRPPAGVAGTLSLFPPLVRVVPLCVIVPAILRLGLRVRRRPPRGALAGVPDAVLWTAALFAARLLLAAGYAGPYGAYFLPLPLVVAAAGLFGLADRAAPSVGRPLPSLAAGAVAVFLLFRTAAMADLYHRPGWSAVPTPAGTVWLPEPVAETTRATLSDLEARFPRGAALVGFPETGFFNYVLGWRNPTRLEQYFPGRLDADGERRSAQALTDAPPDAVLYANVVAVGEGARVFGTDYLAGLDAAVRARTRRAAIYGPGAREAAAIGDPQFFVEVRVPRERAGP